MFVIERHMLKLGLVTIWSFNHGLRHGLLFIGQGK